MFPLPFCLCRMAAMQTIALVVMLLVPAFTAKVTTVHEGHLTADERAKVIKYLTESRDKLLAEISDVSEAQWKFKPGPDRWSVGEVAEHILLAEGLLFTNVERAMAAPVNPDWQEKTKGKTEFIERVMIQRLGKAQAPEAIVPSGKLSRDEVIAKFKEARAKTFKFTETTQFALKEHTVDHPFPVFGTLNGYQWLIYIPLHNIRHNQQIAEVKASPGYPAK